MRFVFGLLCGVTLLGVVETVEMAERRAWPLVTMFSVTALGSFFGAVVAAGSLRRTRPGRHARPRDWPWPTRRRSAASEPTGELGHWEDAVNMDGVTRLRPVDGDRRAEDAG